MDFRKIFKSKEVTTDNTLSELISSVFISVEEQMKLEPLSTIGDKLIDEARCRLCLYSMNLGYISFFIVMRKGDEGKEFMYNFNKLLGDVISKKDPILVNRLDELVLNDEILPNVKDKLSRITKAIKEDSHQYRVTILTGYLMHRMMYYHNAVEEKFHTLRTWDTKYISTENVDIDQVARLFVRDYLGVDYRADYRFSFVFSANISMQSFGFFMNFVKRILK